MKIDKFLANLHGAKPTTLPKILFLDIETSPQVTYTWGRFKETIGQSQVIKESHVLCLAWSWLRNDTSTVDSFGLFQRKAWRAGDRDNDQQVIAKAWDLLNEADIVIGHNLRRFDRGQLNAGFLRHGMTPPRPYKVFDTLEVLKQQCFLPSNSLESATHYFGIPSPKEKQNFELWRACMDGKADSWKTMLAYCEKDVLRDKELYLLVRPFADKHPNVALFMLDSSNKRCPKCGSAAVKKMPGETMTLVNRYDLYQCQHCGGWLRARFACKNPCKSGIATHAVVS